MVIAETDRLVLREMNEHDYWNLYLLNLDTTVVQYTGEKAFGSLLLTKQFISNYQDYKKNNLGRWLVFNKETNTFLGWCGIKYYNDLDMYDIGFRFLRKHWNKGYATEASKHCITLAFNKYKINTLYAWAMPQNAASIAVLSKIGFQFEIQEFRDNNIWNRFVINNKLVGFSIKTSLD